MNKNYTFFCQTAQKNVFWGVPQTSVIYVCHEMKKVENYWNRAPHRPLPPLKPQEAEAHTDQGSL